MTVRELIKELSQFKESMDDKVQIYTPNDEEPRVLEIINVNGDENPFLIFAE